MSLRDRLLDVQSLLAYRKAHKRLGKVSRGDVIDWAHSSVWAIQAGLEQGDLDHAKLGAVGLLAAIDTLLDSDTKSVGT